MTLIDDRTRAPKLLLDILRIGLSLVWGAVVVSDIWNVDLRSLLAAMGVGSIVLGFALQEFLGNLLSGMGLLWAHKFGIGDWIVVDGAPARVVEMDWRTVTLAKGDGTRIVVANSTLAKGNLIIAARADEMTSITVQLAFGLDISPECVRKAVLEAARAVSNLPGAPAASCIVTGISDGFVTYAAILPVANPGILSEPRDEFLSRFWYVAQRHGLRLGAPGLATAPDADARLRMLRAAGAFHGDPTRSRLSRKPAHFDDIAAPTSRCSPARPALRLSSYWRVRSLFQFWAARGRCGSNWWDQGNSWCWRRRLRGQPARCRRWLMMKRTSLRSRLGP
jgi:hypothetical protein